MTRDGGISQATEDAIVTRIAQRLQEKDVYGSVMADAEDTGTRPLIEASIERHAARMRAAGERGW